MVTDGEGTPIGITAQSAASHEVNHIERTYYFSRVYRKRKAKRILYDRAADSQKLRWRFKSDRIRLITPYRSWKGRTSKRKLTKQDETWYKKGRFKVERSFAWLKNNRRLATRYEYYAYLFVGFWQLGCLYTIIKGL